MELLPKSLAQPSGEWLLGFAAISLVLAIALFRLSRRMKRFEERWREILRSPNDQNLEAMLLDHLRERMRVDDDLGTLQGRIESLEAAAKAAKRHVGLVRYDAFTDVHGAQSFSLALYDENGDGAVVSSIVGRSDCRVYCKPLQAGRSERDLSQEEQRAIREARHAGPRMIVS